MAPAMATLSRLLRRSSQQIPSYISSAFTHHLHPTASLSIRPFNWLAEETTTTTKEATNESAPRKVNKRCLRCGQKGHGNTECTTPHCTHCSQYGHDRADCTYLKGVCGLCGEKGHGWRGCPTVNTCRHCSRLGHRAANCPVPNPNRPKKGDVEELMSELKMQITAREPVPHSRQSEMETSIQRKPRDSDSQVLAEPFVSDPSKRGPLEGLHERFKGLTKEEGLTLLAEVRDKTRKERIERQEQRMAAREAKSPAERPHRSQEMEEDNLERQHWLWEERQLKRAERTIRGESVETLKPRSKKRGGKSRTEWGSTPKVMETVVESRRSKRGTAERVLRSGVRASGDERTGSGKMASNPGGMAKSYGREKTSVSAAVRGSNPWAVASEKEGRRSEQLEAERGLNAWAKARRDERRGSQQPEAAWASNFRGRVTNDGKRMSKRLGTSRSASF